MHRFLRRATHHDGLAGFSWRLSISTRPWRSAPPLIAPRLARCRCRRALVGGVDPQPVHPRQVVPDVVLSHLRPSMMAYPASAGGYQYLQVRGFCMRPCSPHSSHALARDVFSPVLLCMCSVVCGRLSGAPFSKESDPSRWLGGLQLAAINIYASAATGPAPDRPQARSLSLSASCRPCC